jgi:hypothetical protein
VTPARLRAYVLIVTRDIVPPIVGAFLSIYLPASHQFAYWQLPLLAGLFGVPLVASRGGEEDPEPMPDTRPKADL